MKIFIGEMVCTYKAFEDHLRPSKKRLKFYEKYLKVLQSLMAGSLMTQIIIFFNPKMFSPYDQKVNAVLAIVCIIACVFYFIAKERNMADLFLESLINRDESTSITLSDDKTPAILVVDGEADIIRLRTKDEVNNADLAKDITPEK